MTPPPTLLLQATSIRSPVLAILRIIESRLSPGSMACDFGQKSPIHRPGTGHHLSTIPTLARLPDCLDLVLLVWLSGLVPCNPLSETHRHLQKSRRAPSLSSFRTFMSATVLDASNLETSVSATVQDLSTFQVPTALTGKANKARSILHAADPCPFLELWIGSNWLHSNGFQPPMKAWVTGLASPKLAQ